MDSTRMETATADKRLIEGKLLSALRMFRRGDFSVRLPEDMTGIDGEIAEVFNDIVHNNKIMVQEIFRVARAVGSEGRVSERVALESLPGAWNKGLLSINKLVGALTLPL